VKAVQERSLTAFFVKRDLKYIFCILIVLGLSSCEVEKEKPAEEIIARAGDRQLGMKEFKALVSVVKGSGDSASLARRMLDRWAADELFYQEAKQKLLPEDMAVETEIEKYRQELINYKYEIKLIENNLDTTVSMEEVQDYYDANRDNFILKDNIVKVNYFKIPLGTKVLDKIKKSIVSTNPKDKDQLKSFCLQYAENYFINDSTWLLLEDVKKEIPQLNELPEWHFMAGRVFEYSDSLDYFYLKIKEIKIKDGLSPINFERNNIRSIILNQRKTKLIKQYKQQILEKAKSEGTMKVKQ
jgi:hypothetical protein